MAEPRRQPMSFKCECEHISHFGTECRSGAGCSIHSGHPYGIEVDRQQLRTWDTPYGPFSLCAACLSACHWVMPR